MDKLSPGLSEIGSKRQGILAKGLDFVSSTFGARIGGTRKAIAGMSIVGLGLISTACTDETGPSCGGDNCGGTSAATAGKGEENNFAGYNEGGAGGEGTGTSAGQGGEAGYGKGTTSGASTSSGGETSKPGDECAIPTRGKCGVASELDTKGDYIIRILQTGAKQPGIPENPVFFTAADYQKGDVREVVTSANWFSAEAAQGDCGYYVRKDHASESQDQLFNEEYLELTVLPEFYDCLDNGSMLGDGHTLQCPDSDETWYLEGTGSESSVNFNGYFAVHGVHCPAYSSSKFMSGQKPTTTLPDGYSREYKVALEQ